MFVAGPPPDAAVIMIGANDVTTLNGISHSARTAGRGGAKVARQRRRGRRRHLPRFRRRQRDPTAAALDGAHAWDCGLPAPRPPPSGRPAVCRSRWPRWSPTIPAMPETRCSPPTSYHPSAAGIRAGRQQLLPALCDALGEKIERPERLARRRRPDAPVARRFARRPADLAAVAAPTTGVPAPSSYQPVGND